MPCQGAFRVELHSPFQVVGTDSGTSHDMLLTMADRGYARISLDTARSGSITKQRQRIAAYSGNEIAWYVDESVSGSKIPFGDRPEGARLLADLRAGDRLLVTKIDRAARSVRDLLDLVERIDKRGASIVFVDQNIDTSGAMGRFVLTLLGAIAELEAAIIAERRKESLESFAREGRHAAGKPPWGFVAVPNPNGRGLVVRVDPELRDLARGLIARVMAGEPQSTVRLETGLRKQSFSEWLRNPRLAGMTPDGDGVVMIDGEPRIDPEAALLSMVEWGALQDYLGVPNHAWNRHDSYSSVLRCSVCGEPAHYHQRTGAERADSYRCRKVKHLPGEPGAAIAVRFADPYIEDYFLGRYGDRRAVIASWEDSQEAKTEAIATAEVRLAEAQRRFSAAVSEEEEDEAMEHLRAAKQALRAAHGMTGQRVWTVTETGKTVRQVWEASTLAERCRLIGRVANVKLLPGRLPVEQKIIFEPKGLSPELTTHAIGSDADEHDDQDVFVLPRNAEKPPAR